MRDVRTTEDDSHRLQEGAPNNVNMNEFRDAVRLFFDKNNVAKYNYQKHKTLSNLSIARISAVHSGSAAAAAKPHDGGGLKSEVFLARGATVLLALNLWQEVGL